MSLLEFWVILLISLSLTSLIDIIINLSSFKALKFEAMKGKICWFVIALQIVSWVSATSRHFPPNHDGLGAPQSGPGQNQESLQVTAEEKILKGLKRWDDKIGSSPPSCENKCYGCNPCEAIQVPTTSKQRHIGIQYANYEPEGWKCKCGTSFYTP